MSRSGPSSLRTSASGEDVPRRNRHDTADFVLEMSKQLGVMSQEAGLDMLAYLLDMVRIEAELVKKRSGGERRPDGEARNPQVNP